MRRIGRLFDHEQENARRKRTAICVVPLAANALAWIWALVAFRGYPVLFGTALLAYTLGLRHAVDADHIAAIDNVARKLTQMQKRPLSVGLFFSLESVRRLQAGLHSFLSMRRIEARRKNARAFRLRHSQSLAKRRQRLSQAMVRSTIQRFGKTTNPLT